MVRTGSASAEAAASSASAAYQYTVVDPRAQEYPRRFSQSLEVDPLVLEVRDYLPHGLVGYDVGFGSRLRLGGTLAAGWVHFSYDSLWVVTFRPDTQPDSTVRWRPQTIDKLGYDVPQDTAKTFDWATRRVVFLPKSDSGYRITKLTGFASFVPSAGPTAR